MKKAAPKKATAKASARSSNNATTTKGARKPAGKKAEPRKTTSQKTASKAGAGARTRQPPEKNARAAGIDEPEQQSLLPPDKKLAQVIDERLLVPQRVAALAFNISVEALKKWKVKQHSRRGRETLYNLQDLIAYRVNRADANENQLYQDRARLARVQAEKIELELEEMRGNLIPADVILENWEPLVGAARQKVLAIPAKLKSQIPALTDDDIKTITEVCRATLEDLANGGIPKRARSATRAAV